MGYYRKKPRVIEAIQLLNNMSNKPEDYPKWFSKAISDGLIKVYKGLMTNEIKYLEIKTLEGTMTAEVGDWIIQGVKGEIYPCKDNIFKETYEKVREYEET